MDPLTRSSLLRQAERLAQSCRLAGYDLAAGSIVLDLLTDALVGGLVRTEDVRRIALCYPSPKPAPTPVHPDEIRSRGDLDFVAGYVAACNEE